MVKSRGPFNAAFKVLAGSREGSVNFGSRLLDPGPRALICELDWILALGGGEQVYLDSRQFWTEVAFSTNSLRRTKSQSSSSPRAMIYKQFVIRSVPYQRVSITHLMFRGQSGDRQMGSSLFSRFQIASSRISGAFSVEHNLRMKMFHVRLQYFWVDRFLEVGGSFGNHGQLTACQRAFLCTYSLTYED